MSKKIFVSYSWGTKEHQDWVVNLCTRLRDDTVDVILDRWDLKEGHDVYEFMETMVNSDDVFRVLIVSDKKYTIKSNNRDGGVGTETQIITPNIYGNQKQEKFIPIVLERDGEGNPFLPAFLASRKYIDFSQEEFYEDSYEELLRNILQAPALPKPKLGTKAPLYITESTVNNSKTNSILRTAKNQLDKKPEKVNSYTDEFMDAFLENLWDFEIKSESHYLQEIGANILKTLIAYKPLKDDFVEFTLYITKPEFPVDIESIISFFEKQSEYKKPRDNRHSWSRSEFEFFEIVFHELFIYTISSCLKNKNYKLIGELLYSNYYTKDIYQNKTTINNFTYLADYHECMETYIKNQYNKITGFGDYLITNLSSKIKKEIFILADLICHYISELHLKSDSYVTWFPTTYIYKSDITFDFFVKLSSKRFFDKVQDIFNVSTADELTSLIEIYSSTKTRSDRIRFGNGSTTVPFIHEYIDYKNISRDR